MNSSRTQKYKDWVHRATKLNRQVVIEAPAGFGKTRLLQNITSEWPNVAWVYPDEWSDQWQPGNSSTIIWEDLHLLTLEQQTQLFRLCRKFNSVTHIYLTQEEPKFSGFLDLPKLRMNALSVSEIEEELSAQDNTFVNADVLHSRTGGIPALVNLAIVNNEISTNKWRQITDLPDVQKKILAFMALSSKAQTVSDIELLTQETNGAVSDAILALKKKFLIELSAVDKAHGEERWFVPSAFHDLIFSSLPIEFTSQAVQEWSKRELPTEDLLAVLVLSSDENIQKNVFARIDLTAISSIRKPKLQWLLTKSDEINQNNISIEMIKSIILLALGQREEAGILAQQNLGNIEKMNSIEPSVENYIVEAVGLFNRIGKSQDAIKWSNVFLKKINTIPLLSVELEKGVALINSQLTQAIEELQRVNVKIQDFLTRRGHLNDLTLIKAKVLFQLGRAYDIKGDRLAAEERYLSALELFQKLQRPYFASVTKMNLMWLAYHLNDEQKYEQLSYETKTHAETYGYDFVLSGVYLSQALRSRLKGQYSDALRLVQKSISLLRSTAPISNVLDAQRAQVRILYAAGLRKEARTAFESFKKKVLTGAPKRYFNELPLLELEIQSHELTSDDILSKIEGDPTQALLRTLVERGLRPISEIQVQSIVDQQLVTQRKIQSALIQNNWEDFWLYSQELQSLFESDPVPSVSMICSLLSQASVIQDEESKKRLLDRVRLELPRVAGDEDIKRPLRAWLDVVSGAVKKLEQHPLWLQSLPGDREAIAQWRGVSDDDNESIEAELVLSERTGDVVYKGQKISDFQTRPILRRLLKSLLQSYPNGVSKEMLASLVWQESYDPRVHDSRIYTSIQRVRQIFGNEKTVSISENGYVWKGTESFKVLLPKGIGLRAQRPLQNLILEIMLEREKTGIKGTPRTELSRRLSSSDATLKRELKQMVERRLIRMDGQGRSVIYSVISGA